MSIRVLEGDVRDKLRELSDESVHCVVTSPPYFGLRDYGVAGQIGLEPTMAEFLQVMVDVFREVRRVLRKDGTCWINLGDSYNANQGAGFNANAGKPTSSPKLNSGLPPKNLLGIPWRVAFALQADGWYLRQDIIWAKPNPMPESVTDRCTKAHEYLFLLTRSPRYHYDAEAIAEPASYGFSEGTNWSRARNADPRDARDTKPQTVRGGDGGSRNRRSVWTVVTHPFSAAHFATFPPALIEPCIKAGCPRDCCAKCGAPFLRKTFRPEPPDDVFTKSKSVADDLVRRGFDYAGGIKLGSGQKYQNWLNENPLQTTGWSPSCSCDAGLARGTVLDPFGGAGTTGLVADRLQRDAILIELNPEYAQMARDRLIGDGPLFADVA